MHYLNREARREVIMLAAMRVALQGGLGAMTVRQIAAEAGVSTGQLHHHFTSIGELKAQAFVRLIREMLDIQLVAEDASWRERLFSMLGSEDGRLDPYIRLWREGQLLCGSDSDIKEAYLLTMSMWHEETVNIIRLGSASGEFHPADSAENIAWRLIALVCGLDGIYALGMEAIDDSAFTRYINHYIALELLCPPTI
ncbi:TetR family transcriptional regulator [Raoultella planticola]|jgi:AcrR family transcriptional regulator|uniref:TetR family transcriptional regulator n=2 Tax=Raoultella planticola TaxID=575 RepID=A0A443VJW8_RAOPL|nr:TetR family transcriptional regulator [Raoultella planticola]AUV53722.1 TetR family transcriptional regulator [Raoultella planticola]EIY2675130.1 TetR family transcriptional regulator [Raoultella planticola]EJR0221452.1 TetR family transcriptional regulator [Raoultella planticola]EJR0351555.1 TetR family transcriptional regulator [Raoultella planticola]EKW5590160.1 TetR family transcriptional regulator [Raoultella planticola]